MDELQAIADLLTGYQEQVNRTASELEEDNEDLYSSVIHSLEEAAADLQSAFENLDYAIRKNKEILEYGK